MLFGLSLGTQAEDWLQTHPDKDLVRTVAHWINDVLCDDAETESLTLVAPSGQRREVSRVPGTKVDVTWLEAAPFRTIKVIRIDLDTDPGAEPD